MTVYLLLGGTRVLVDADPEKSFHNLAKKLKEEKELHKVFESESLLNGHYRLRYRNVSYGERVGYSIVTLIIQLCLQSSMILRQSTRGLRKFDMTQRKSTAIRPSCAGGNPVF